jgi:hypothetical protein
VLELTRGVEPVRLKLTCTQPPTRARDRLG